MTEDALEKLAEEASSLRNEFSIALTGMGIYLQDEEDVKRNQDAIDTQVACYSLRSTRYAGPVAVL